MSTLVIGTDPERIIVQLEAVSDFWGEMERSIDWPTGATLTIAFADGSTIPSTIVGPTATFDTPVPSGGWTPTNGSAVNMVYTEPAGAGTFTEVIAKGTVKIV